MALIIVSRFILVISISTYVHAQGWCGKWEDLKPYSREQICCAGKVLSRFDAKNQELGCCRNQLYIIDHHNCIDGELVLTRPLEHARHETTRPLKIKLMDKICRKKFVYTLHNITMTKSLVPEMTNRSGQQMTNGSDQKISAKVRVMNLRKWKQMEGTKWKTFRLISINVPESMSRKYVGKNTMFVFSDKNLLREKSLDLSLEDVIMKDTFKMINIKRCGTT
ncbi:hypothetical protein ACJMK2_029402 [Sinanodonta woodiana]|uniref:Uncharacterized protein n=1 Tax=Sinanodonta woodiana TaxID=1069815 RepID=A0ABD3XA22_SINWO